MPDLLDQQFSVASRGQLPDLGMKNNAMQWRIRAGGPWQVLLPDVYLSLTGAPNLPQREMAALLYAGPGSVITGPAALMHHGLRSPVMLEMVDVLVPMGRQRHSTSFARLHRTKHLPSRFVARDPLRFVLAARAVADTARLLTTSCAIGRLTRSGATAACRSRERERPRGTILMCRQDGPARP
jgi:hypothetical protein